MLRRDLNVHSFRSAICTWRPTRRITVFLVLVLSSAHAGAGPIASAYHCSFISSGAENFDQRWIPTPNDDRLEFIIAAVDLEKGTAQVVGEIGVASLSVREGIDTLNFVEATPYGNPILTTIFTAIIEGGKNPAILSRHVATLLNFSASQFVGYCEPKLSG